MDNITGGTVLPITPIWLGAAGYGHTSEQPGRPISQADLDATNVLQQTDWHINRDVLTVAKAAWLMNSRSMLGFDPSSPPSIPQRISYDAFMALDQNGRDGVAADRAEAHLAREVWRSQVSATWKLLQSAEGDKHHPKLWMAWGVDSRLRRYPRITSGPNPQGSGLSRALLEFATPKALGSRGLWWLAVRAGTCAGLDKTTHAERAAWTDEHLSLIRESARYPLGCDWWHTGKDDPWGLLATCFEIDAAMSLDDPASYPSRLPCCVDGTTNGLQHLSALGLDSVGALATNLGAGAVRRDIYTDVAETVAGMVAEDAEDDHEIAGQWLGRVERETVKRAVMTSPYGVTVRGIRDQLLDNKRAPVPGATKADRREAASYLRDHLWTAIGETAVGARQVMGWLQTIARELARHDLPLRWETPTGSYIQQAYRPVHLTRPLTAFGRVLVASDLDRTKIKGVKQAAAASPNFVHSFDAAHLAMTVNACAARGVTSFSMVHDSFGTHACDMDVMATVLRETFVAIYSDDWLAKTYEYIKSYAGDIELTPPPKRGSFNIEEVLLSDWFFA